MAQTSKTPTDQVAKHRLFSGSTLLLAAGLFIALNILSNQLLTKWRLDVTDNHLFTLSEGTTNILNEVQEPITLRYYFSAKKLTGVPQLYNYGLRVRDMLEEFAAKSGGNLKLTVIDPEPFSEAEDQAVANGIQQLPLNNATGEFAYLGLAASNTTDDDEAIPMFQPNKEDSLEYDLTKLIYKLSNPKKRVIGIMTGLPIHGDPGAMMRTGEAAGPWTFVEILKEVFEVKDIAPDSAEIPKEVDTLMVLHPKKLSDATRYAIDQFVLKGGKAMVFVDPYAEQDQSSPPEHQGALPDVSSDLPDLMEKWGVKLIADKIVGDRDTAIRVSFPSERGPQEVEYLPWLRLTKKNFNRDDFITNELKTVHVGSAGILEKIDAAGTTFTPLMHSSKQSMPYDRETVMMVRDPGGLLTSFKSGDKELVLAARISGKFKTAFPNGKPKQKDTDPADPDFIAEAKAPVNLVVVADSDILADRFWVRVQNFLGNRIPSPFADNATFLVNALDNLGGNNDLISLRSRGHSARPFEKVKEIQRDAEAQFRDKERELQAKLQETEAKINQLQSQKEGGNAMLLSPAQRTEIEKFRDEQVKTRKELRSVQHDLQKNIEWLGGMLKFINIGLVPLAIGALALFLGYFRAAGRSRQMARS